MRLILQSDDLEKEIVDQIGIIALDRGHWEEAVDLACKAQAQHMGVKLIMAFACMNNQVDRDHIIWWIKEHLKIEGIEI
jgi:hypothetical protein